MIQVESSLTLKFKDDNSSGYTTEIPIELRPLGTTESFTVMLEGGQYRSRQMEIVIVSTYDTIAIGFDEDPELCDQ